ncbi:PQQ-binding-like beta-propeller repeat protein [Jatrophihabitans sp.]|uniref:outer membrane protein assembly factor BamB family protein n=1 Tax=Jatrophihabitans sp. TaxID=1932789 RepID=UPI0030C7691F|nr:hypothetical protein [Jatrophihabitans sp.]
MRAPISLLVAALVAVALPVAGCSAGSGGGGTATRSGASPAGGAPTPATPAAATSYPDWPTYHGNASRSGISTTMPAAHGTPKIVKKINLDGAVYGSPIVAGGRVIAVTENDSVYEFSTSGKAGWHTSLGAPSPAGERPCGDIDPLGITSTPVYAKGVVYVSAELGKPVRHQLVALSITTGKVLWRRSVDLSGTDAAAMQQRGALTIAGGRVWVPFGGLAGDCGNYKGRLVGVSLDGTGSPVSYTVPTAREAGIWTPPGPTVNGGHLFVAVGNGASGVGDAYDHSDSVLEVSTTGKLLDSFSPSTWPTDNDSDLDLGSQGPAIVAGKWVYADGKSGTAYVLRLGHLGGIGGQVSKATVCKSFGGTAVSGSTVYVPCTDGVRAVGISSAGKLSVLWHAASGTSASPVVGGGRVWAVDAGAGVLHGLDPKTGKSLAAVTVGATNRFVTPALWGTEVLVGTLRGLTIVSTS